MCITVSLTPFSNLDQHSNVRSGENTRVKFQMVTLLMFLMVDSGMSG